MYHSLVRTFITLLSIQRDRTLRWERMWAKGTLPGRFIGSVHCVWHLQKKIISLNIIYKCTTGALVRPQSDSTSLTTRWLYFCICWYLRRSLNRRDEQINLNLANICQSFFLSKNVLLGVIIMIKICSISNTKSVIMW